MKKKLLLLVVLFLLSGCDVNYNLTFNDEQLIENVDVIIPNSEKEKQDYLETLEPYAIFDGIGMARYNINVSEEGRKYQNNYNFTYTMENFGRAYYINQCFDAVNFSQSNNQYTLMTSTGFYCMVYEYNKIDNVTITVTTNHEVISHNADQNKGNNYIWNITEENADEVKINMIFGGIKQRTFWDILMENMVAIVIIAGFIIILGVTALIIVIKAKKNNEI